MVACQPAPVGFNPAQQRPAQQEGHGGPENETPDVGLPGDAGGVADQGKLPGEPKNQEYRRRNCDRNEEEDGKNGYDSGSWEQNQVSAHYPGNGAGGADQRRHLSRIGQHKCCSGGQPRSEIEQEISARTVGILDVVAEYP